ncbi:MAG: hypothetical protein ACTSP4_10035 [Candidatus Hodarchaeales archaeon]
MGGMLSTEPVLKKAFRELSN